MKPKKILLINRHIPPEDHSSLTLCMGQLADNLTKLGHEVHFLGLSYSRKASTVIDGIHYHRIPFHSQNPLSDNLRFTRLAKEKFIELHAQHSFDIVNIHESRFPFRILSMPSLHNTRIIYTFHASVAWEYRYDFKATLSELKRRPLKLLVALLRFLPNYLWLQHAEGRALARADEIHVASLFAGEQVTELYSPKLKSKIRLLPFGVDYERFHARHINRALVKQLHEKWKGLRLLTVRRLVYRMGLEHLLVSLSRLKKSFSAHFSLMIVGKGPLEAKLKQMAVDLDIADRVLFAGFVPDDQLPTYYDAADLFILPSLELEGFGLVLLEAMAMGCPVVGSDAGAISEVIGQAPGCQTYPRGDDGALARAIIAAGRQIDGPGDLAKDLREYATTNFRWDRYAKAFLDPTERTLYSFNFADK